jgi:hypothetical protein
MKTTGRFTATLLSLLALYVFGYWVLIKNHWADKLLRDPTDPFGQSKARIAITNMFQPISELDWYWNMVIPNRKYLTGHWRSETGNDFVTLGPEGECQFQLGQFTFNGKAEYESQHLCFEVDFIHENRVHRFILGDDSLICTATLSPPRPSHFDYAVVYVYDSVEFDRGARYDFEATLTKHPPSAPAP